MTSQGFEETAVISSEPPARPVQIFLVDDHDLVREGLASLLSREPDLDIVGSAPSAEAALGQLPIVDPDVVIADVRLPGLRGPELCREIAERRIRARVIILSAFMDDDAVHDAWLAGASGYIVKDIEAGPLKWAIRAVAQGGRVIDPKVAGTIVGWAARLEWPPADHLPPHLQRILQLLCQGRTNEQIIGATSLPKDTVKKYLGRIYRRLGVTGRTEAIREAKRRGMA